jgi:hypothetical protein
MENGPSKPQLPSEFGAPLGIYTGPFAVATTLVSATFILHFFGNEIPVKIDVLQFTIIQNVRN